MLNREPLLAPVKEKPIAMNLSHDLRATPRRGQPMTQRRKHLDREPDSRLPRPLAEDLARLYDVPVSVPPEVDEKIAALADRHCEAVRARRRIRRWGQLGVAAAVLFLVVWIYEAAEGPKVPPASPVPIAGVRDIDRSGRVDILDAFALARHIEGGRGIDPKWDVNHDGVIDQADVDAVAMAAVRLISQPLPHGRGPDLPGGAS